MLGFAIWKLKTLSNPGPHNIWLHNTAIHKKLGTFYRAKVRFCLCSIGWRHNWANVIFFVDGLDFFIRAFHGLKKTSIFNEKRTNVAFLWTISWHGFCNVSYIRYFTTLSKLLNTRWQRISKLHQMCIDRKPRRTQHFLNYY